MASAEFQKASEDVQNLKAKPSNDHLLELYGLYKQATDGDVSGKRPGMIDFKGRAKFDAWSKLKGTDSGSAESQYIQLVEKLKTEYGF